MRVTVDADCGKIKLLWKIFKGVLLCRKFPDKINRTKRGYHLIWYGLNISIKKHFVYRKFIGDDWNRIRLDMNPKRVGQVLFTKKRVWIKKDRWERVKYCKICKLPLTRFWVFKYNNYYCIHCGVKNVKILEVIERRREFLFNSFLSRISNFEYL